MPCTVVFMVNTRRGSSHFQRYLVDRRAQLATIRGSSSPFPRTICLNALAADRLPTHEAIALAQDRRRSISQPASSSVARIGT